MIKKFFSITKWPISITVGGFVYFWLISNPQESYPIPIILYWIPNVIGWNGFFIFLGILAGLITLGFCISLAGEDKDYILRYRTHPSH